MKDKPQGYAHLTAKIDELKRELAEAQAEIVRLKGEAKSWEKVFKKTVSTWLMQKPNLRQ
jgi:DNA-nicking Smr family endonuclease